MSPKFSSNLFIKDNLYALLDNTLWELITGVCVYIVYYFCIYISFVSLYFKGFQDNDIVYVSVR